MIQDWKLFRKDTAFSTRSLVWYTIILTAVSGIVSAMAGTIIGGGGNSFAESVAGEASAIGMIAGVLVGVCCLLQMGRKTREPIHIFKTTGKKMTIGSFMTICVFIFMAQFIFTMVYSVAEKILNIAGLSMEVLADLASIGSDQGIFMMIYAGFVGPIVEELVYRGFLLRQFEKYGKLFALIMTSVLFGIMHANPLQIIFGILMGLLLGYIALEYSIKWSIAVHIINNFVLGEGLQGIADLLPVGIGDWFIIGLFGIGFVLGIVILVLKRNVWIQWLRENKVSGELYWNALTTPSALLFIGYNLFNGLSVMLIVLFPDMF